MIDLTVPVSVAVFFVGLILTIRIVLPRLSDIKKLHADLGDLTLESVSHTERLLMLEKQGKPDPRLDDLVRVVSTLRGGEALKSLGVK